MEASPFSIAQWITQRVSIAFSLALQGRAREEGGSAEEFAWPG